MVNRGYRAFRQIRICAGLCHLHEGWQDAHSRSTFYPMRNRETFVLSELDKEEYLKNFEVEYDETYLFEWIEEA